MGVDTSDIEAWFACPWCRSDESLGERDGTNVSVDHIGGKTAFGVRCHDCGQTTNWRVTPDGIECITDE